MNLLAIICLLVMLLFLIARRKLYHVALYKTFPLAICVAGMGLLGTYIMYFFENGIWYGRSFFGALLFFPILLIPVAWIFRLKPIDLLNYATVPGVVLLAIYKWNCYVEGCCGGKAIGFSEDGIPIRFPSQVAEMVAALLIAILLLVLERKNNLRKIIYPICIIVYGTTRIILNYFRMDQTEFIFGLTAGTFWSIVAVLTGSIWLVIYLVTKKGGKSYVRRCH